jgi:hypothetical protein
MVSRHVLGEVLAPSAISTSRFRIAAYRAAGVRIGRSCRFEPGQHFVLGDVSIGDRVYLNRGGLFDAYLTSITIATTLRSGRRRSSARPRTTSGRRTGAPGMPRLRRS